MQTVSHNIAACCRHGCSWHTCGGSQQAAGRLLQGTLCWPCSGALRILSWQGDWPSMPSRSSAGPVIIRTLHMLLKTVVHGIKQLELWCSHTVNIQGAFDFFLQVLHAPELPKPENATLLLSQVVINGLDKLNMSAGMSLGDGGSLWEEDDSAPFLVVFQYGLSVWAGFPVTRVRDALDPYQPPRADVCS